MLETTVATSFKVTNINQNLDFIFQFSLLSLSVYNMKAINYSHHEMIKLSIEKWKNLTIDG